MKNLEITQPIVVSRPARGASLDPCLAVLVVDQDAAVHTLLGDLITSITGFPVASARTMSEMHQLLETSANRFFCTVINFCLPDAPHGEAIKLSTAKSLPAIVMTSPSDHDALGELRGQRVIDYVLKTGLHEIEHVAHLIGRLRDNQAMKILVVDDSRSYRAYLTALLQHYFYATVHAADGVEALEVLAANPDVSLVITDINMPRKDGFALIQDIRQQYRREDLAIIGLSDNTTPGLSSRILKAGGNDFLAKPFEQEEFYCRVSQNTNMIAYVRKIQDSARIDFLTGTYNRRALFETGESLYQQARGGNIHLAASLIDADYFKKINDTYGHEAGDHALKAIARSLTDSLSTNAIVARYGGEEFACLAVVDSPEDAASLFEKVRADLEAMPLEYCDQRIPVTVSVGVTTAVESSLESMLKRADEAVYMAKKAGRNCVVQL